VKYVEHSTGALGHGVSVAVGHAIYLKKKAKLKKYIFW
jgi:transketolase N-terminal domain/subunit